MNNYLTFLILLTFSVNTLANKEVFSTSKPVLQRIFEQCRSLNNCPDYFKSPPHAINIVPASEYINSKNMPSTKGHGETLAPIKKKNNLFPIKNLLTTFEVKESASVGANIYPSFCSYTRRLWETS